MKVVIIGSVLVVVAMMVIFVMALIGVAAMKSTVEQTLEDEDQIRYVKDWMTRKSMTYSMHDQGEDAIVQSVESHSKAKEKSK